MTFKDDSGTGSVMLIHDAVPEPGGIKLSGQSAELHDVDAYMMFLASITSNMMIDLRAQ